MCVVLPMEMNGNGALETTRPTKTNKEKENEKTGYVVRDCRGGGLRPRAFEWGGAIAAEDGQATVGSSATAYLLYSDSAFGSITSFDTDSKTTNVGGTLKQTHAISSAEAAGYAFADTYSNSDYAAMNGYYAVVMVDGANMYYNTFTVSEFTSATTPMQDYKVNMDWSGSDYLGDPARKGTVTGGGGTPEPTSGLLLLVGAAMLGLRRKRA